MGKERYNKILIAIPMFTEAHRRFNEAKEDVDYIVSIILSGCVIGIISPLLKEQGGITSHELLAKIANLLEPSDNNDIHEGAFRAIYNSLKHAGNTKRNIQPSKDLEFTADLKQEAEQMLSSARDDFLEIKIPRKINKDIPKEFIKFMEEIEYFS